MSDGTSEEQSAPSRYFPPAEGAPKRRGRKPKGDKPTRTAREAEPADAFPPELRAAMDGWGNPLRVVGPKGTDYWWVTDEDLSRFSRNWTMCRWGVDDVQIAGRSPSPDDIANKAPITFRELKLYRTTAAETERIRRNDPNRMSHELLRQQSARVAETGVAPSPDGVVAAGEQGRMNWSQRFYNPS